METSSATVAEVVKSCMMSRGYCCSEISLNFDQVFGFERLSARELGVEEIDDGGRAVVLYVVDEQVSKSNDRQW